MPLYMYMGDSRNDPLVVFRAPNILLLSCFSTSIAVDLNKSSTGIGVFFLHSAGTLRQRDTL